MTLIETRKSEGRAGSERKNRIYFQTYCIILGKNLRENIQKATENARLMLKQDARAGSEIGSCLHKRRWSNPWG